MMRLRPGDIAKPSMLNTGHNPEIVQPYSGTFKIVESIYKY